MPPDTNTLHTELTSILEGVEGFEEETKLLSDCCALEKSSRDLVLTQVNDENDNSKAEKWAVVVRGEFVGAANTWRVSAEVVNPQAGVGVPFSLAVKHVKFKTNTTPQWLHWTPPIADSSSCGAILERPILPTQDPPSCVHLALKLRSATPRYHLTLPTALSNILYHVYNLPAAAPETWNSSTRPQIYTAFFDYLVESGLLLGDGRVTTNSSLRTALGLGGDVVPVQELVKKLDGCLAEPTEFLITAGIPGEVLCEIPFTPHRPRCSTYEDKARQDHVAGLKARLATTCGDMKASLARLKFYKQFAESPNEAVHSALEDFYSQSQRRKRRRFNVPPAASFTLAAQRAADE